MIHLLFGPPGAGKGTQSDLLKVRLGAVHLSTGDLFRAAIKGGTALGKEAKSYMDAGKLVPDSVTIGLVREKLQGNTVQMVILDGFPRNVSQAEALDQMLIEIGVSLGKAVFLDVPKNVLLERLSGRRVCAGCGAVYHAKASPPKVPNVCDKCGGKVDQRIDDREEAVATRLEVYESSTSPLRDFYLKREVLERVDGLGTSEEVFRRIEKVF